MPAGRYNFSYLVTGIISRKKILFVALAIGLTLSGVLAGPGPALGQESKVRAGVFVNPPFVMQKADGIFYGMAIDLWRHVADNLQLNTTYIPYSNFDILLKDAKAGRVDIILTNVAITYERTKEIKFTYPWFDSGLRLMVLESGGGSVLEELYEEGVLFIYILLFIALAGLTFLLTMARRKWDGNFFSQWHEGLSFSLYELVVTAKSGRIQRDTFGWKGYILASAWIVVGVVSIAYVTSTLTTALTTVSLTQDINSLNDLPGKNIGVIAGGVGHEYMLRQGFDVHVYGNIEQAAQALIQDKIQAVAEDAPVLEYWANTHPGHGLKVVGSILHPDKYAFAGGPQSGRLIDRVSLEIIRLHDLDLINSIRSNYFGRLHL